MSPAPRSATVTVRAAAAAELPTVVAALGQEHFFVSALAGDHGAGRLLVAWQDGHPVGDVFLRWSAEGDPRIRDQLPGVPQLVHLEVAPAWQRRGVGTRLIAEAEDLARARGHGLVTLSVGVHNRGAYRLYRRLGYDDWGHGMVRERWVEPDGSGGWRAVTETCRVLVKLLTVEAPGLDAWDAWHPQQAAHVLAGCPVPWAVAGGWALDLWHGRQTRAHDDLEIAIPRAQLPALRPYLLAFDLYGAGGGVYPLGPEEQPRPEHHQVWVCEPSVPAWRMDIFLEPGNTHTWVSHRDPRVRMPLAEAIGRDRAGVPYLVPQIVLLAKAKRRAGKDEADLDRALPRLDVRAVRWLRAALARAHPGHPWLARLDADRPEGTGPTGPG